MDAIISPASFFPAPTIFLAGSITGACDWQATAVRELQLLEDDGFPSIVFNPRRKSFDVSDSKVETEQIEWEFRHLRAADAVLFWFAKETLGPITLFELGRHSMTGRPLFIGTDPEYKRRRDVEIQMGLLTDSGPFVHNNLFITIDSLKDWVVLWHQLHL